MIVTRVLNNNVVIGVEDNVSYLLMGLSIGFKRRVGDPISSESIEKLFVLTNPQSENRLNEMISFIPDEYFDFSSDAVAFIKRKLKREFSDNLYIMLTDHIFSSVGRYRKGITVENALLMETKRFYRDEYEVAKQVVDMANKTFNVNLSSDEAGFITFHIVNSQTENNASSIQEMTRLIQEILALVKNKYNIEYKEDKTSYSRFVTHLKYFSQKIFSGASDKMEDQELLDLMKFRYPNEHETACEILELVRNKYGYEGSSMDTLYLTLHIARVINE